MGEADFKFSAEARQTIASVLKLDDPGDPDGNHDSIIEEVEGWASHYRGSTVTQHRPPVEERDAIRRVHAAVVRLERALDDADTTYLGGAGDLTALRQKLIVLGSVAGAAGKLPLPKGRPTDTALPWLVKRLADLFEALTGIAAVDEHWKRRKTVRKKPGNTNNEGLYEGEFFTLVELMVRSTGLWMSNHALGRRIDRILAERTKKAT